MQINLKKALFLSYLLTVALSCEAAPGELNAAATPPPCNGTTGAAECLIAYQQPELELVAGSNGFNIYKTLVQDIASCGRGSKQPYTGCVPPQNPKPHCDIYNRNYPYC